MRFASLELVDFNLVKESGIEVISVTFTEMVQIIIGTNGSGKTSVLRQLSPIPAVRTLFGKKGHKILVIEKDGVYYRLESEYEKPSSPHLFFEGDNEENLNIGRTTAIQQELIAEHLGITPLIDNLIMNRYVFPKWTPQRRKEFLMDTNPDQIGFVLTKIKLIASKIKACKNNIARLQSRKILLEQELLDEESLALILQEREVISSDLAAFQQNLMDIEVGMRTLQSGSQPMSLDQLPSIRRMVRQYHYRLSSLSHINRDDRQRQLDREETLSKLAVCNQRLTELDNDVLEQSAELADLETRYRELDLDGDLQTIDQTIHRLEGERDKLQISRPAFELSAEELQVKYKELEALQDRLDIFSHRTVTLLPMKKRQHRERLLSSSQYKQLSYRQRLADYEARYDNLSQQHRIKPRDIPDSPCAKERCPLYAHFMGEYTHTEEERQRVGRNIEKAHRYINRLDRFVEGLGTYLKNSQPYVDQIQWLVSYAQSNPILHQLLRQMDILTVLSTNPSRIPRQLQDSYDHLNQWLKLKEVLSNLDAAYTVKARQISSESHDTIKLVSTIEKIKTSLYELRGEIMTVSADKRRLSKLLEEITSFSAIKSGILDLQEQHRLMSQFLADGYEKNRLMVLKRGVEELRNRHFLRLSDIEKTLRSQSSLKERYQEEVLSQIVIIEKELADLQHMETALIAIPKENMIAFINDVFEQANRLIASIWTVPLHIELVKLEDSLNYEFYVSGDNQSLRELSECSEGQTEILSLAINLALRIVLGHLHFPLCLDEAGRTFDDQHKTNLVLLLRRLLDDNIISQLFLVSHNAMIHEGFSEMETLVIREDNIVLPQVYNQHATFA